MTFADQEKSDLATQLERSVLAVATGGRFVSRLELPSEAELVAVNAELARVCRSSRRGRVVWVLPMPTEFK